MELYEKEKTDPQTGFIVGSQEYKNYYFPKIEKNDVSNPIYYKTCDGKEVATMEEVMAYNQMFYDAMKIKTPEEKGMHR